MPADVSMWRQSFLNIPQSMHIQPHGPKVEFTFCKPAASLRRIWVLAFRVFCVSHPRCIQLERKNKGNPGNIGSFFLLFFSQVVFYVKRKES